MKTMAYYSLKWHSTARVLEAQLFQPLPRTQAQRGRQQREAETSIYTAACERFPQRKTQVSAILALKDRAFFSSFL